MNNNINTNNNVIKNNNTNNNINLTNLLQTSIDNQIELIVECRDLLDCITSGINMIDVIAQTFDNLDNDSLGCVITSQNKNGLTYLSKHLLKDIGVLNEYLSEVQKNNHLLLNNIKDMTFVNNLLHNEDNQNAPVKSSDGSDIGSDIIKMIMKYGKKDNPQL